MEEAKQVIAQMDQFDDKVKLYLLGQEHEKQEATPSLLEQTHASELLKQLTSNQCNHDQPYYQESVILRLKILITIYDSNQAQGQRLNANAKMVQNVGLITNIFGLITILNQSYSNSNDNSFIWGLISISLSVCAFIMQKQSKWFPSQNEQIQQIKNYLLILVGSSCFLDNRHVELNLILQTVASTIFLMYNQWDPKNYHKQFSIFILCFIITQVTMVCNSVQYMNSCAHFQILTTFVFVVFVKLQLVRGVVSARQQKDQLINNLSFTSISHIFESKNKNLERIQIKNDSIRKAKSLEQKISSRSITESRQDLSHSTKKSRDLQSSDNESYHMKRPKQENTQKMQKKVLHMANNSQEQINIEKDITFQGKNKQEDDLNVLNVEKMICQNFFASSLVLKFEKQKRDHVVPFKDNLSSTLNIKPHINKIKFKLIQMTRGFFNKLPKVATNFMVNKSVCLKKIQSKSFDNDVQIDLSKQNQRSNSKSRLQSDTNLNIHMSGSQQLRSNESQMDLLVDSRSQQNLVKELDLSNIKSRLNQRIFKPYFISNQTLLHFQKYSNCRLSLIDIIESFISSQNKVLAKFYFKVEKQVGESNLSFTQMSNQFEFDLQDNFSNRSEERNNDDLNIFTPEFQEYIKKPARSRSNFCGMNDNAKNIGRQGISLENKKKQSSKKMDEGNCSISSESQNSNYVDSEMNVHYDDYPNRANIMFEDNEYNYFEFELKIIDQQELSDCSYAKSQNMFQQTYKIGQDENMILINVREISNFIKNLQTTTDKIYLDAIEANYSHESMTPLNCIIANTRIVQRRLNKLMAFKNDKNLLHKNINYQTLKLLNAVEQSGVAMRFNCCNHVKRMQIRRGQFKKVVKAIHNLESQVYEVIDPFAHQIESRGLNIYSIIKKQISGNVLLDAKSYQLIIFNIIQNAVKYNLMNGEILIQQVVKPQKNLKEDHSKNPNFILLGREHGSSSYDRSLGQSELDEDQFVNYVLETQIIDTGIGIDQERQKLLFIPLQELKHTKDFNLVKDFNIGLGLSCSKTLTDGLKGDIILKQSERGFTVFAFRIPVKITHDGEDPLHTDMSRQKVVKLYGQSNTEMSKKLQTYVKQELKISSLYVVNKIETMQNRSQANRYLNNSNDQNQKSNKNSEVSLVINPPVIPRRRQQEQVEVDDVRDKKIQFKHNFLANEPQNCNKNQKKKLFNAILFSNFAYYQNEQQKFADSHLKNEVVKNIDVNNLQFSDSNEESKDESQQEEEEVKRNSINIGQSSGKIVSDTDYEMESSMQNAEYDDEELKDQNDLDKDDLELYQDEEEKKSLPNLNQDPLLPRYQRDDASDRYISPQFHQMGNSQIRQSNQYDSLLPQESQSYPAVKSSNSSCSNVSSQIKNRLLALNKSKIPEVPESRELEQSLLSQTCQCKETILLVDDQEFNIEVVKTMMQEEFDIQIDSVNNGKMAVDRYKSSLSKKCGCLNQIYKLIIMDIQMPIMNGIDATTLILSQMRTYMAQKNMTVNPTQVVALTSYSNKAKACEDAGFTNIYNKPLKFKDLHRIIWTHHYRVTNTRYDQLYNLRFQSQKSKEQGSGENKAPSRMDSDCSLDY